ncbi:hypothetical protein Tco_0723898 [Tanacetum coccineum]
MSGTNDENPPPPPPQEKQQTPTQQTPQTVSTIKLPILKKGEYDIWAMKIEHYLAHTDYPIWEWPEKEKEKLGPPWAFRTAYKLPIRSTPFRIVYEKACYLPIEIEHKSYWALRHVNLDLDAAGKHRYLQLNELVELRNKAYEDSSAYKERTKRWHDAKIMDNEFHEGEEVLVFNSRLKLFPGKLKSRWYRPYIVSKVFPYGAIEALSAKKSNLKSS